MAPECQHNKPTTKASDIWSLGCILYQLHTGLTPFRGGSDYLIFKLSGEAEILRLDKFSTSVLPQEAKDLMKLMVVVDQEKRLTIEDVLKNPYFDCVRDLKECPVYTETHAILRDINKDLVTRNNVYKYDG